MLKQFFPLLTKNNNNNIEFCHRYFSHSYNFRILQQVMSYTRSVYFCLHLNTRSPVRAYGYYSTSSPPNLAIAAPHKPTRVTALLHHPVLILWFLWLTASSHFLCGLVLVPLWLFLFSVGTVSALTLTARSAPPRIHSKPPLISCNYTLLEQLSIWPRWETNTNETYLLMFSFLFFARNQWRSFFLQAYDGRLLLVLCSTSETIQLPKTNMASCSWACATGSPITSLLIMLVAKENK